MMLVKLAVDNVEAHADITTNSCKIMKLDGNGDNIKPFEFDSQYEIR